MDIAILSPLSALPKIKKLAKLFRHWGGTPKNHQVLVCTTPSSVKDMATIWEGLNAKIVPILPGVVRQPPMSENEPFFAVAQSMTKNPWVYLNPDTVPLVPEWADLLENEYLASGKSYLGIAGYIPQRYRDASGIDRVNAGEPYLLEAAVYPPSFPEQAKKSVLSRVAHHEVSSRYTTFPNAYLSELMVSAEWREDFRLKDCPKGTVLATRLANGLLVDELLGLSTPPAPEPEPVKPQATETVDSATTITFPVKEPTIKVISSSQKAAEATTLEKRGPGRPRKNPSPAD